MRFEEFWALYQNPENQARHLELIHGELLEMPASSTRNSIIALRIGRHLGNYADEHDLGYVTGADAGFCLDPHNAPQPDTAFIRKARVPNLEAKVFEGAPDIAVEVISPSESRPAILRKTRLYLEHGGQSVWAVYPEERMIEVYSLNASGQLAVLVLLDDQEILEGGPSLPGFRLSLGQIFKD
jgi:Uma2 family endonuclease